MLERVVVTPSYRIKRRGKWYVPRWSARNKEEKRLGDEMFYTDRWTRMCTTQEEKETHITEMTAKATRIIEQVKQKSKRPDKYMLDGVKIKVTDVPRSWKLSKAVSQLGGKELKIYLDESGLAKIENLSDVISAVRLA